ncbi:MAG: Fur family transcriptional regulator [Planctomycetota bacterium]
MSRGPSNQPASDGSPSDDLRDVFRGVGLRCTRQRELVYSALAATKAHPTADELHLTVKADEPGLSLATVYNTLEAFTAAGLCRRLPSSNGAGPCRYDADTSRHAHVALADGRVVDVPIELGEALLEGVPPELVAKIESELGVSIDDVSVTLHARSGQPPA